MSATRKKPKFDDVIDGTRVRVYATRIEYEVVFDDDELDDPDAEVLVYPKIGTPDAWAHQGRLERGRI